MTPAPCDSCSAVEALDGATGKGEPSRSLGGAGRGVADCRGGFWQPEAANAAAPGAGAVLVNHAFLTVGGEGKSFERQLHFLVTV